MPRCFSRSFNTVLHKETIHMLKALANRILRLTGRELCGYSKFEFYRCYRGGQPGLFFCDADHDYEPTLHDLTWARTIGAKIICGHDYDPVRFPGVVRAVKELGGPSELVGSLFVL